jgi:hypothetical protein
MEIKKLITIFKRCLPFYEAACKENWNGVELFNNYMHLGLCHFYSRKFRSHELYNIMSSYYTNWVSRGGKLFPYGIDSIKLRLQFLKDEIVRLQGLLEEGYTHV